MTPVREIVDHESISNRRSSFDSSSEEFSSNPELTRKHAHPSAHLHINAVLGNIYMHIYHSNGPNTGRKQYT